MNVSEIIVEEETQDPEFPERPEIFTWLLSLDKRKPPHEETEDFVKRALDSKNIYLDLFHLSPFSNYKKDISFLSFINYLI